MALSLVIFDCDGVLVDSEPIACGIVGDCLADLGIPVDGQYIATRYAGVSAASMYRDLETRFGMELSNEFREAVRTRILEEFAVNLRPMDGLKEALSDLSIPACVASSSDLERVRISLSATGLLPHFGDHLFSSTQVRLGKPAPDLFLFAAQEMGANTAECVVIEDSMAGIRAASAAGMFGAGFYGGSHCLQDHADRLRENGARITFNSFSQLAAILDQIERMLK